MFTFVIIVFEISLLKESIIFDYFEKSFGVFIKDVYIRFLV